MYIILAGVISLIVTLIAGKLLIPALVKLKAGQSIKEIGPTWHMTKQGTPTMGGLMFIIGIGVAILAAGWPEMLEGRFTHLYVYAFALVFGVIGYIDDYQKVKHHQNTGLTAPQKFILQLAAAVAFLCLMRYEGMLSPNLYIPFFNTHIVMNWVVYMIFAAFVIVGTVNAVNITDGLDGLSSSVTLPVALFFAVTHWNGYFTAMIYVRDKDWQPLQIVMREILMRSEFNAQMLQQGGDTGVLAAQEQRIAEQIKYALIVVASVPVMCIYPFVQKHFVKGVTVGAVKG